MPVAVDSPAMSPPQDHYFTARPASGAELRRVPVRLAGRDVEVVTAGGIFSPDGIDRGTRVLLAEVPPPPPGGNFLDLGCGWGPLALTMALESPGARVLAVDVNERALDLARRNAAALGVADRVDVLTPSEVPSDLAFDLVWSNPPIRVGKAVLHDLLTTWLPRLATGGAAHLVVQKNLGADSLQTWMAATLPDRMGPVAVDRTASSKGFRILRVARERLGRP